MESEVRFDFRPKSAARVWDFAKDELENRLLDSVRRLSHRNRLMACRIVELMSR